MKDHTFALTVYKESRHLEACIKSLLVQSIKTNIIIVTSTPTIYSREIAERYHIPYYVNDVEKMDAATNWNFAIAKAPTSLVTVAHQDDIYLPGYAEAVLNAFAKHKHKNIQIAFTGYVDLVNDKERRHSISALVKSALLLPFQFKRVIGNRFFKSAVLLLGNPICCPSVIFNKAVVGNFEFTDKYQVFFDWYAWYELSHQPGSFLFIKKRLISRRIHIESGTSLVSQNGSARREELRFFEMIWGNKFIARAIASLYKFGDLDNQV